MKYSSTLNSFFHVSSFGNIVKLCFRILRSKCRGYILFFKLYCHAFVISLRLISFILIQNRYNYHPSGTNIISRHKQWVEISLSNINLSLNSKFFHNKSANINYQLFISTLPAYFILIHASVIDPFTFSLLEAWGLSHNFTIWL